MGVLFYLVIGLHPRRRSDPGSRLRTQAACVPSTVALQDKPLLPACFLGAKVTMQSRGKYPATWGLSHALPLGNSNLNLKHDKVTVSPYQSHAFL